jgi:ADP-ribosyl-[dinitrogen reductase] hydrolase
MTATDRYRGCLLGLAAGDAVGTTVEFKPRGSFPPVTDMTGGGPFHLPAGAWTDDTSMALCLAASLGERGRFDAGDQMARYLRWHDDGYLSSTGRCFDIGNATRAALDRYRRSRDPFAGSPDRHSAGNGCLMRLAAVPIFAHARGDRAGLPQLARDSARTTHAAAECLEATELLAEMLYTALSGASKPDTLAAASPDRFAAPKVRALAAGDYVGKPESAIRGSGYVIDCLEAAAWCFARATDFREAVLLAANLGDDADTTAAVAGQLAGAFYGEPGIPPDWLAKLVLRDEIVAMAEGLEARSC